MIQTSKTDTQIWITRAGQVDWSFQNEGVQSSVRALEGVTGVGGRIVLKAQAATSTVKADIEEAFERRARADAGVISVAIDGAEVTLGGAVHSWAERSLARGTARATTGVHRVIDHMTVVD
jgi:osmotically-inducible protein OsmY